MRLKFFACAAAAFITLSLAGTTRAADPKAKADKGAGAKKKSASELLVDDKALNKQMSWEEKVMGPDDKRAELDKIARAQAITKAAAEKAEKEKAEKEKQAAREAAQPKPQVKRNDVSLPSVDEESAMKEKAKPEVVEAPTPPPPPVTKGDDKFIDKILKDDGGSKKKLSKENDRELEALLGGAAKDKPAAKGKSKKGDMVDNLLDSADKSPDMPAPKTKATLPEWAKPEIAPSAPPPPPVAVRPQPKKDDGVIHVVQGAAAPSAPAAPTARPMPVAARATAPAPVPVPASRRQMASAASRGNSGGGGNWNDPFADGGGSGGNKKAAAAARDPFADDAPAPRKAAALPAARREPARSAAPAPSGNWNDPFADSPSGGGDRKAVKRAAPAPAARPAQRNAEPAPRGAGWKDPFTEAPAPSASHRPAVAMREAPPTRAHATAPRNESHASSGGGSGSAGWGSVLKKRR